MEKIEVDISPGPNLVEVIEAYRERAETFAQMAIACRYCYEDFTEIDPKAVKKQLRPVILEPMLALYSSLDELSDWSSEAISSCINSVAAKFDINMGKLGQPLRVAVTGSSASPSIDITLYLIGKARSIERLGRALEIIKERGALSS